MRQQGLQWDNVERCFLWNELSRDFIRELVEADPTFKTQLEHHLLMCFHGYASYPSYFFMNMYTYIKLGLAEQKELVHYKDQIYMLWREQAEQEYNSRHVYSLVDCTGRKIDQWVM